MLDNFPDLTVDNFRMEHNIVNPKSVFETTDTPQDGSIILCHWSTTKNVIDCSFDPPHIKFSGSKGRCPIKILSPPTHPSTAVHPLKNFLRTKTLKYAKNSAHIHL